MSRGDERGTPHDPEAVDAALGEGFVLEALELTPEEIAVGAVPERFRQVAKITVPGPDAGTEVQGDAAAARDLSGLAAFGALVDLTLLAFPELPVLPALPALRRLELDGWGHGQAPFSLAGLAELAGLEWLQCLLSPRVIRDAQVVGRLPLKRLFINGPVDGDLGFVASLTELESLTLYGVGPSAGAAPVPLAPTLTQLSLDASCQVDPEALAGLTRLEGLWLEGGPIEDLGFIRAMPSLTVLSLRGSKVRRLPDLPPGLEHLILPGGPPLDLAGAAGCTALETVDLEGRRVKDLGPLASSPSLKEISLDTLTIPPEGFEALRDRPGLTIRYKHRSYPAAFFHRLLTGEAKLPKLKDTIRPAWPFKTARGDAGPLGSGFCGTPYRREGQGWPLCGICGAPMPLLVQLDLAELPGSEETGLFQLFYCVADGCEQPFAYPSPALSIGIVHPAAGETPATLPPLPVKLKARKLVELKKPKNDKPNDEDLSELFYLDGSPQPVRGDKVGGWPDWIQGAEWPHCETCGDRMDLFLQLNSRQAVDHTWADVGQAYVFRCPTHREAFSFCLQSG